MPNLFDALGNSLGSLFGFVLWFFFDLFGSFIPAAFVFVILVKLISFPFELKSRKAMLKNAKLSEKLQDLQKKYANNKRKLNEETAKLYEREGINPFGGCLPQLFPLFLFIGVFGAITKPITNLFHVSPETMNSAIEVIKNTPEVSHVLNSSYFQLNIIEIFPKIIGKMTMFTSSQINDIIEFNHGFNFFGLDLFAIPISSPFESFAWIWPALSAITMFLTIFIAQKTNGMPQQQASGCMKFFPYVFPLFFVYMTLRAPAALGAYYSILNLLSIFQNLIYSKFFSPSALSAREEAARAARLELDEKNEPKIN